MEQPGNVLKIHDLEAADRPQERAERYGCDTLSTADLWALVLRSGQPGVPITRLCRELMAACGDSMLRLQRRTRKQNMAVKGIGLVKAIQIEAVMTLLGRYHSEFMHTQNRSMQVRSAADIYEYMKGHNANSPTEEIWVVHLNRANRIMGASCVSKGGATASVFDVKKTIKSAILEDAEGVVLCHNHPSGALRPSDADDRITKVFKRACEAVDLRMLDHVIVSHEGYYSYNDHGRL